MYFCTMKVRLVPFAFLYFDFRRFFISSRVEQTVMPLPRLVNSPGLMIQMLRNSLSPLRFSFCRENYCRKC